MKQATKAFTMVELIVAISIISILASILYGNYTGIRAKARDEVRQNTLKEMQVALELYKSQYGQYPEACNGIGWSGAYPAYECSSGEEYIIGLAPDFISELPVEEHPIESDSGYIYTTNAERSAYKFMSYKAVEKDLVQDYNHDFSRCPVNYGGPYCGAEPQENTYAIYSLGAEDW